MVKRRSVGDRMREARLALGMKQCEFARLMGVHPASANNWEAGRAVPTLAHVTKAASILGADFSWLATGETQQTT